MHLKMSSLQNVLISLTIIIKFLLYYLTNLTQGIILLMMSSFPFGKISSSMYTLKSSNGSFYESGLSSFSWRVSIVSFLLGYTPEESGSLKTFLNSSSSVVYSLAHFFSILRVSSPISRYQWKMLTIVFSFPSYFTFLVELVKIKFYSNAFWK